MDKDYNISYIMKIIIFTYVFTTIAMEQSGNFKVVIIFLIMAAISIIKERFNFSKYVILAEIIFITIGVEINYNFIYLYSICIFDLVYEDMKIGIAFVAAATIYFSNLKELSTVVIISVMFGIIAYALKRIEIREKKYIDIFDSERRLRYELENTKAKLLNSSKEIAHFAEVNERNRIARDIHDNIGHSLAGIFMQLQVVLKLYGKDDEKAKDTLKNSVEGLSKALVVVRETVHNIKPKENLGVEYIKEIIDNFHFCKVNFSHAGDFSSVLPSHYELIATNIKEALTNASKYSNASTIDIKIEINKNYIRLYIKDDGVGTNSFKEGLGLSGMRERVKNFGGNISINGDNGFLIVCIIPINEEGGKIFETINSR